MKSVSRSSSYVYLIGAPCSDGRVVFTPRGYPRGAETTPVRPAGRRRYADTVLATIRRTMIDQPAGMSGAAVAEAEAPAGEALLSVRKLRTSFFTPEGVVHAVDNVSFDVRKGEAVALVGESGCGKSVTAMSIMRLGAPPGRVTAGEVRFKARDLVTLSEKETRGV